MSKTSKMVEAGVGLAAVAALGTYLFYGKHGKENREKVSGWMLKLKGEVLEKAEEIKKINQREYYKIVDEVTARYSKAGEVGAEELNRLAKDLKDAWKHISRELN
ncbi:MAG TPA: hypothetical protein DDW67_05035 [Elusimicrobia bacterium]|nr:hypothetical protein [Elusimicrobiota bacterium]